MTLTVTKEDVLSFSPCASDSIARLDQLFGNNTEVDANYVLSVDIESDHKLWLLLRPQMLAQETLDAIRTDFLSLIPTDGEWYEFIANANLYETIGKMMRSLEPQSFNATADQLLLIVRSHL